MSDHERERMMAAERVAAEHGEGGLRALEIAMSQRALPRSVHPDADDPEVTAIREDAGLEGDVLMLGLGEVRHLLGEALAGTDIDPDQFLQVAAAESRLYDGVRERTADDEAVGDAASRPLTDLNRARLASELGIDQAEVPVHGRRDPAPTDGAPVADGLVIIEPETGPADGAVRGGGR